MHYNYSGIVSSGMVSSGVVSSGMVSKVWLVRYG